MHSSIHAARAPDKSAIVMAASGATISYAELEAAANRSAHALRELGVQRGDVVAVLFDNGLEVFVFGLAALRCGLYLTSVSNKLSHDDAAYIFRDSGAGLLVFSDAFADFAAVSADRADLPFERVFSWSGAGGRRSWTAFASRHPGAPIEDQSPGIDMLYSSGTTGRPKGIKAPLPEGGLDEPTSLMRMGAGLYGMGPDTIYLSPAPLYHAAPLRWAMTVLRLGGTVIVMDKFDPEVVLSLIEGHAVTHAQFVPTHFVRLLRLDPEVRYRYNHSTLRGVIHAASPCPIPVKQAMIEWFGPIVHEYYAGTEGCGLTAISAIEWLERPGSVGRAIVGSLRITDDDGDLLPAGAIGNICFADGPPFEYLNDPEKTATAHNKHGWAMLGDIGYVDEQEYLFLTDRRSFMIISGGVNIYPQEIENALSVHPAVLDVAVIGLPDEEMGEKVVAVVSPTPSSLPGAALAEDLRRHCRASLGGLKTPKAFVFRQDLPREPTGKLMKRLLIDQYKDGVPASDLSA